MKLRTRIVRAIALAALSALLLCGCGDPARDDEHNTQTQPADMSLTVESVEQEGDMMVVTTSWCVVKYPFAFSDIVGVTAENREDQSALLFSATVNGTDYPLYSIRFDSDEGVPVGTLVREDGEAVAVTVQFFQPDETLDGDILQTVYAAQETVNEVIGSLMEVPGFTSAP